MGLFDAGARSGPAEQEPSDRVLTVPNAITAARLAGLPVFVWLVVRGSLGAALAVLVAVAATDWVDGYVARRFGQVSRLGALVDPLVDRVLLATVLVTLLIEGIVPWPLAALALLRDAAVLGGAFALFGRLPPIPVNRAGKAATALLLVGVPLFLLAAWRGIEGLEVAAWVVTVAGLAAYYGAAWQYARAAAALRRSD